MITKYPSSGAANLATCVESSHRCAAWSGCSWRDGSVERGPAYGPMAAPVNTRHSSCVRPSCLPAQCHGRPVHTDGLHDIVYRKHPNSSGLARNSPYSSSSGCAAGCGRPIFAVAPIPSAMRAVDMRCRMHLPHCEPNERLAISLPPSAHLVTSASELHSGTPAHGPIWQRRIRPASPQSDCRMTARSNGPHNIPPYLIGLEATPTFMR